MALYYLDTSAAFKLLAAEEHAEAFLAFYREHRGDNWISSDLLRIEVSRAVARNWPAGDGTVARPGAQCPAHL
jgi:predicted nucleic acid-binding protein